MPDTEEWLANHKIIITSIILSFLLTARGILLLTGSSGDSNQAEVLTQSETMQCSIFDFPVVLYGVTGVLVGNSILACGGTDYFTGDFFWKRNKNHSPNSHSKIWNLWNFTMELFS